jgi:hypothetical protein
MFGEICRCEPFLVINPRTATPSEKKTTEGSVHFFRIFFFKKSQKNDRFSPKSLFAAEGGIKNITY